MVPPTVTRKRLAFYFYAHAAGGTGNHADGGIDIGSVQVGHLQLGDLLELLAGDLANLGLVGHAGTGFQVDGLLDEDGRGESW